MLSTDALQQPQKERWERVSDKRTHGGCGVPEGMTHGGGGGRRGV